VSEWDRFAGTKGGSVDRPGLTSKVVPRALVPSGLIDASHAEGHLGEDSLGWERSKGILNPTLITRQRDNGSHGGSSPMQDKPSVIPGRVVPHVLPDEVFDESQLVPHVEMAARPLPMCPSVVVFCVCIKHLAREGQLPLARVCLSKLLDDDASVVPDLIVLGVFVWVAVEEVELHAQVAPKETKALATVLPDRVIGCILSDKLFSQAQCTQA